MRRVTWPAGLALGIALLIVAMPVRARAAITPTTTFGAPLTQPPDATFTCTELPLASGMVTPLPNGGPSCTWSTPQNPGARDQALTTPAGAGTITAIRVRVGPVTGPMSFVVLQSSTNALTGVTSCCEAVMVTQPVLPTANEINAFRADIPVETDAPGEQSSPGIEVTDFLALAVLNPRTPIPVISQTASGLPAGQLPQDTIQSPAPLQGTSAPTTQTAGYQLDLQADWVPGTPTPPVPRVRFASGRVFVSHGYLHVPLRCRYDTCKGTVVVRAAGRSRVTYATGSFRIGQNLYRSIAVPLTADGRTAALDSARRSVSIVVTYQTPSAPKQITRRIALRF